MEDHPGRFFSNRSLLVKFALLVVCAIVPFAVVWSVPGARVVSFTIITNYWFAAAVYAAVLTLLIVALVRVGRRRIFSWIRECRWGIALALILAFVMQVNEPHRAKVLYDEDLICGAAYMMHTEHLAAEPTRMHMINNTPLVTDRSVDKRPIGYPFLLSVVHDLTGYRYTNVFVLNAVLGFVLLILLWAWSRPLVGDWGAGGVMILMCTLPLLAQNVTAAGFEVFNMCMIAALVLAVRRYLYESGAEGMDLMIATALVLSIARYESVLYLVAVAIVIVFKWTRERHVTMTWFAAASPLLLFSALTSFHMFMSNDSYFQLDHGTFLSFAHLPDNAMSALRYVTAFPYFGQSNSLLLFAAGVAGVLVLPACFLARRRIGRWAEGALIVLFAFMPVMVVNTTIGLMENLGAWELPYTSRFSLPMYLFMVLCFAVAFAAVVAKRGVVMCFVVLVSGWFLLVTLHQNARHIMTNSLVTSCQREFIQNWADANAAERDLIVDDTATGMILHGHPCVMFGDANRAPWKLKALLDEKLYDHVYVCEVFLLAPDMKTWALDSCVEPLDESPLKMKVRVEERIRYNVLVRISELQDVADADAAAHRRPKDSSAIARWLGDIYP